MNALVSLFVMAAAAISVSGSHSDCHRRTCELDALTLKFSVLGDFGGLPVYPYYSWAQTRVAKALAKVAENRSLDFHVELGDNFYYWGVRDDEDFRFNRTFEDIYQGNDWLHRPWYVIAGNHDHHGNVSAQVDYTTRSQRWHMPSLYYKLSYQLANDVRMELVMIDTIVLCGNTLDGEFNEAGMYELVSSRHSEQPRGPLNPDEAEVQWQWIHDQLSQSNADYLFVAGHYPVYSIGSHGPTQCLVDRLAPQLKAHRVTAYLSGHDHNIQHLHVTPEEEDGHAVNYFVSGAASRSDRSVEHERSVPDGSLLWHYPTGLHTLMTDGHFGWNPVGQLGFSNGAFATISLDSDSGRFDVWTGKGKHKYDYTFPKRFSTS